MTAVKFQNMPPLSPEEYAALEESIREHGIQVPVVVDENRVVIDGHHRQKIALDMGIDCPKRVVFDKTDAEKRTLALSLNLDRRHLSRDQRRALIAESVKADPELSDREHGRRTGATHPTVAAVRDELGSSGKIYQSEVRVSADGRSRPATQPASKPKKPPRRPYEERARGQVLSLMTALDGLEEIAGEQPGRADVLVAPLTSLIERAQNIINDIEED